MTGVPYSKHMYDDGPRIVIWETTRACALACVHCRAEAIPHRDPRELTTAEAYALIDELAAWGKAIFILTGGDPLMRPDIFEIVAYAAQKGLRVAVSPSATGRLTARSMAQLIDAGCKRISLSLDGATPGVHDAFRGVRGAFERTLKLSLTAQQAGMELQINTTIALHNHQQISEMGDLVMSLGARVWSVFFLVPVGRAQREQSLDAAQTEQAFAELYRVAKHASFALKTTEAPHYRRFVAQHEGMPARSEGIGDGKGFVFISHVGEIQPSGFLPITCGNVRDRSVLDVYRNDRIMRRLRRPETFVGKCGACEYHDLCGGSRARAYAYTGDSFASEPTCGYIPRKLAALAGI